MHQSSVSTNGHKPQNSNSHHQPDYDINLSFYELEEENNISSVHTNRPTQQYTQPTAGNPRRSAQYREEFDTSFYQLPGPEDSLQSRPTSIMEPVTVSSGGTYAPTVNLQPNNSISRPPIQQQTISSPPLTVTRSAPLPASAEFILCLHQLCDVGFTKEHSTIALKRCNNNVEEAIAFCLEHDDEAMQQYINEEIVAHDARLHALVGNSGTGTGTSSTASVTPSANASSRPVAVGEPTPKSKNVFKRMIGLKSKHAAAGSASAQSGLAPSIAASPNSFNMPVVAVEPTPVSQPTPPISFATQPSRIQIPSTADAAASLSSRSSVPPPAMNPSYHVVESELDFSGLDGDGASQEQEAVLNYSAMEEEVLFNAVLAESALEARQATSSNDGRGGGGGSPRSSVTSTAGAAGGAALIRRMSNNSAIRPGGSPKKSVTVVNTASTSSVGAVLSGGVTLITSEAATPAVIVQPPVKPARPPSMHKMNSTSSASSSSPVVPLTPVSIESTAISGAQYVEITHEAAGSERWSVAVARAAEMSFAEEEEEEEEISPSVRPVSSLEDYGALIDIQSLLTQQQQHSTRAGVSTSSAVLDEVFAPTVATPSVVQSQSVFVFPEVVVKPSPISLAAGSSETIKPVIVPVIIPNDNELSEFGYTTSHSTSFIRPPPPAPFVPTRSAMLSAPSIHGLEISDSFADLVDMTTEPSFDCTHSEELSSPSLPVETSDGILSSSDVVSVKPFVVSSSVGFLDSSEIIPIITVEDHSDDESVEEDVLSANRGHKQSQYNFPTGDEVRDDERYLEEDRVNLDRNSASHYRLAATSASNVRTLESIPEGNTKRSRQNLLADIDGVLDKNHGAGTKLEGSVSVMPATVCVGTSASVLSSECDAVVASTTTAPGKLSVSAGNKPPPPPVPKLVVTPPPPVVASPSSTSTQAVAPVIVESSAGIVPSVPMSIIRSISAGEEDEDEEENLEASVHVLTAESHGTTVTVSGYEGDADTVSATEVEAMAETDLAMHGSSDDEEDEEVQDAVRRVNEQILRDEMLEMASVQTDDSHDNSNHLGLNATMTDNNAFITSANTSDRSTFSIATTAEMVTTNGNSSSSSSSSVVSSQFTASVTPHTTNAAPLRANTPPVPTPLFHEIQTYLQSVHKRKHLPCIVNEHNGKFTAQISLKQHKLAKNETSPQGNRSNSVIIGTCTTRELATDLGLTLAPPEWTGKHDSQQCILCRVSFSMFKKGHHCRNCGYIVCVSCSNKAWPSSMLPTTYHDQEKYVRVCTTCQTGTELFVRGLRQGDYSSVLSLYNSGNVNLHCPINIYVNNAHPVHMAAAGGNLQLLQWLIETKKCSVKDNATKKQLVTGKNLSVLAVAAQAGHVAIMRYLIHQRKCNVLEIAEMSILHRALHVALEAPGPMPPYVPPKGTKDDELLSEGAIATSSQSTSNSSSTSTSSGQPLHETGASISSTVTTTNTRATAPNGVASVSAETGYAPYQVANTASSTSSSASNHSANTTPRIPAQSAPIPRPNAQRTLLLAPLGPLNGPRAAQLQAAAATQALAHANDSIATPGIQLVAPLGPLNARPAATANHAINTPQSVSTSSAVNTGAAAAAARLPSYLTAAQREALITSSFSAATSPVGAAPGVVSMPASPSVHTPVRNIVAPRALYNEAPVNIAAAEAVTGYAYTTPLATPNGRGNQSHNLVDPDVPVAATAFLTSDIIFEVSQHDANFSSQGVESHRLSTNERQVSVRHIAVASPYVATARGSELATSPVQNGTPTSYPELIVEGSAAAAPGAGRTGGPRWW